MNKRVKNHKPGDKVSDNDMKMFKEAGLVLGLETHVPVAESVEYDYRYFITEMIQRIEKEYGCKTAIEKSLAEIIGLSHVRVVRLSKIITNHSSGKVSTNKEINDYYITISKELDRAHRQLINAIFTLKQIKMPNIPFNINA